MLVDSCKFVPGGRMIEKLQGTQPHTSLSLAPFATDNNVNILLVDDRHGKLLGCEAILARLGENILKAHTASEALAALLKYDVAVVLIRVSARELDAFSLAGVIRQHSHFRDASIIFVSAGPLTDRDLLKGYEHGAVDFISVPIVPELLRARVKVFAELHRKNRQLETLNRGIRNLSSRLITMQDEERRRIARELHDGLGQELTAAKMTTDAIRKLSRWPNLSTRADELSHLIDGALTQVRSLSHLLHPPLLDETGLLSTIQWYLDGLTKRSGIRTVLEAQPLDFPRLHDELEITLYRIVQEALTNVFRHSGAKNAWVFLSKEEDRIIVSVRDDGKGIPEQVAKLQPGTTGVGIGGMRQRLTEFGGQLRLENRHPGTLVEVIVPLPISTDALAAAAAVGYTP
jgi:signal transduction histidine kinase